MKTKRFEKKLVLNKNTIAHLNLDEMNVVQGGLTLTCATLCAITCEHVTGEPVGCGTRKSDCCTTC